MLRKKMKTSTQKKLLPKTISIQEYQKRSTKSHLISQLFYQLTQTQFYQFPDNLIFLEKLKHNAKLTDNRKLAVVTPVFKKENYLVETNYRPVTVLQTTSKNFEKLMEKQSNHFIQNYLFSYLCRY